MLIARFWIVLVLLLGVGGGADAQTAPLSPAECQALRERVAEHARASDAARRALGVAAVSAPSTALAPADRADAIRARLAQIRQERQRLEEAQVAALVKLEFDRLGQIREQMDALDRERRTLEAEAAGREGSGAPAPPAQRGADLGRMPCRDLPALEQAAVRARRKELGGAERQEGLVPLVPVRGHSEREVGAELARQLGAGAGARQRLGLLDQDGDARVDGFVDSPAAGLYRLYRERADGSVAVDLFMAAAPPSDMPYWAAVRRLDQALLRHTQRRLADLLSLRPVGPVKLLGETGDFADLRGLVESGRFDRVVQAARPTARSIEFQNYRGEIVRRLEVVAGGGGTAQLQTATVRIRQDGTEEWEQTLRRFRPVSFWRTEVEVDRSQETRQPAAGAPQARTTLPTVRFTLER